MKSLKIAPLIGAMLLAISAFVFSLQPATKADAANALPAVYTSTQDLASIADAAGTSVSVTIPGVVLGDACLASYGVSTVGMTVTCNVTAANTVIVRVQNESGGAVDLASTTQRVYVFKPRQF